MDVNFKLMFTGLSFAVGERLFFLFLSAKNAMV